MLQVLHSPIYCILLRLLVLFCINDTFNSVIINCIWSNNTSYSLSFISLCGGEFEQRPLQLAQASEHFKPAGKKKNINCKSWITHEQKAKILKTEAFR